jgi:hypothetical protein
MLVCVRFIVLSNILCIDKEKKEQPPLQPQEEDKYVINSEDEDLESVRMKLNDTIQGMLVFA